MYFKLRQSSLEDKSELLGTMVQSAIENTESLGVKGALKAEEAKYAYQVLKDNQKARCLFRAGLLEYPTSKLLCFSFLLFELGQLGTE